MSRRDEREVILVEREAGSFVMPLLFGLAVGAGLGLLFAPQSGEETRRLLQHRVARMRDLAGETLEEWHDRFSDDLPAGPADSADEDQDIAAVAAAPKGRRTSSAREELERRLAEARARRRTSKTEDEEPVA
jgi:gas vesicle protein